MEYVRFTEAGRSIDKKRVVGLGRFFSDTLRGGMGKPVRSANDKVLKRIARVQEGLRATVVPRRPRRSGTTR